MRYSTVVENWHWYISWSDSILLYIFVDSSSNNFVWFYTNQCKGLSFWSIGKVVFFSEPQLRISGQVSVSVYLFASSSRFPNRFFTPLDSWHLFFIFPQCFCCFLLSHVPHSGVRLSTTQAPFMPSIYFAGPSCSTVSAVLTGWGDEDDCGCGGWHKFGVTFDPLDRIISCMYSAWVFDTCTHKLTFCYN